MKITLMPSALRVCTKSIAQSSYQVMIALSISLITTTVFAGTLECSGKKELYVTAESEDMSTLRNLTFMFNGKNLGSIMDFRSDKDVLAQKPVGHNLPKKVNNWNSYRAEKNEWIQDGSFECLYEVLTEKREGSFAGYISALCVSGDGGVWKADEDLKCQFE